MKLKWLIDGPLGQHVVRIVLSRLAVAVLSAAVALLVDAGLLGGELGEQLVRLLQSAS